MKKILVVLLVVSIFVSCQNNKKKSTVKELKNVHLIGAGATFPMPFYISIISAFNTNTGISVNYTGTGSEAGIRSLKDKVVDFCATDAYLNDIQATELAAPIVHVPTCLGAVALAYNLPGISSLRLKSDVLVKIFMGEITNWNDKQIKSDNPGIELPNMNISVIYRADGSGTTFIFSNYMSKISKKWARKMGVEKLLKWPVGNGVKGNMGVAEIIKQTKGAFGYLGFEYAILQKLPVAKLQNKAGNYIEPSVESVSAAAKVDIPSDTRMMLTNSSNPDAYPISTFSWIIIYKEQAYKSRSLQQAEATLKFINWVIGPEAQAVARKINYSPLPVKAVIATKKLLESVTYEGKPIQ